MKHVIGVINMDKVPFRVEDESELADAIAKKVKQKVLRIVTWAGPYDAGDLDEVESKMFGGGRRKARKESVKKQRRGSHSTLRHDSELGERSSHYKGLGARVRKALGLEHPLPVEKLGYNLLPVIRPIGTPGTAFVWYPKTEWLERMGRGYLGYHIWSVAFYNILNPTVDTRFGKLTLGEVIHLVSVRLNCHPALALAFLLCELPVQQDEVTVVIHHPYRRGEYEADPNITLYASRPDVPIWVASYLYQIARLIVLRMRALVREEPCVGTPRPRGISEKVHALTTSVEGTSRLDWKQRLSEWNAEHPEWKYRNVNSMRAVYYRAKAVRTRGKGGVRSSRKPTREGGMSHEK